MATVSPWVVWNFARPGCALAMLSRFFSSIAVTALSFSSVGASFFSLSCDQTGQLLRHRRGVNQKLDDRLPALVEHTDQIVGVEDQRVDLLRCAPKGSPVTSAAVLEQVASVSLRSLSDCDSRVMPSNVGPSCGAI